MRTIFSFQKTNNSLLTMLFVFFVNVLLGQVNVSVNNAITTGTVQIVAGETIPISHSINESGIILCEVTQGQNTAIAAAAFSPFDIEAFADEPTDFDNFWTTQKNNLATIPIDPQLTFYANNDYATTYRINLANINNRRIYGYLSIPNGSGSFPAIITFPPFGDNANLALSEHELAERYF